MVQRVISIGDIHGCANALESLLGAIDPNPEDVIVTLGDYVDRGPDTRSVLTQLIELKASCELISLTGNHEIMMLDAVDVDEPELREFWLSCGGAETVASYGQSVDAISQDHIQFIRQCRRHYETDTHFFVHANYDPDLALDKQPDHLLFWEHLSEVSQPHQSGKVAIVGHTPQLSGEILDRKHLKCIDTYCFGTGWLTALDVTTGISWQADQYGQLRS